MRTVKDIAIKDMASYYESIGVEYGTMITFYTENNKVYSERWLVNRYDLDTKKQRLLNYFLGLHKINMNRNEQ